MEQRGEKTMENLGNWTSMGNQSGTCDEGPGKKKKTLATAIHKNMMRVRGAFMSWWHPALCQGWALDMGKTLPMYVPKNWNNNFLVLLWQSLSGKKHPRIELRPKSQTYSGLCMYYLKVYVWQNVTCCSIQIDKMVQWSTRTIHPPFDPAHLRVWWVSSPGPVQTALFFWLWMPILPTKIAQNLIFAA